MSAPRKLTDAQVAWVRATRARRDELIAQRRATRSRTERVALTAAILALPTVQQQVDALGVSRETVKRIRLGYAYVMPEPVSLAVPCGTSPNNCNEVSSHG
ncbi:MAG TPA: hypothetical protein VFS52_20735 [Steroidobacteraceae bacterium]|nr:hypothetical protein [Steroidobacteraceae bacterium]